MSTVPPTTAHVPPSLVQAFEDMRLHTKSFDDMRDWMVNHVELLTYGVSIPKDAKVKLDLTELDTGSFERALETGTLFVHINLKIVVPFTEHPLLADSYANTVSQDLTLMHTNVLALNLEKWPVAAAYLTGYYLYFKDDYTTEPWIPPAIELLNKALAIHFPGYTVEKLAEYIDAGFLLDTRDREKRIASVSETLFSSYVLAVATELPCTIL